MSAELRAAANRLQHWLENDAIPLWLARGMDPKTQAHYERLLPSGAPDLEASVRVRVQARQAFFFTLAADRGWCDQGQQVAYQDLTQEFGHANKILGNTRLHCKTGTCHHSLWRQYVVC